MDKQALENWVTEGFSIRDIASHSGNSFSTVRYWLKKYGLVTNKPNSDRMSKTKLRKCRHCKLEFEMNTSEIANHSRWCDKNPLRAAYDEALSKTRASITDEGSKANQYTYGATCSESTKEKLRLHWKSKEIREKHSKRLRDYFDANPEKVGWQHHGKWKIKESYPERYFREVFESHGLIDKFFQEYRVKRFSLDFAFPHAMLAVEIDGSQHSTARHIIRDKRRDEELQLLGWETIRIDWSYFMNQPKEGKQKIIENVLSRVK